MTAEGIRYDPSSPSMKFKFEVSGPKPATAANLKATVVAGEDPPALMMSAPPSGPVDPPTGYSGPSGIEPREEQQSSHFVPLEDRWRIAAYIRALQLSHQATTADVPAAELEGLKRGGGN